MFNASPSNHTTISNHCWVIQQKTLSCRIVLYTFIHWDRYIPIDLPCMTFWGVSVIYMMYHWQFQICNKCLIVIIKIGCCLEPIKSVKLIAICWFFLSWCSAKQISINNNVCNICNLQRVYSELHQNFSQAVALKKLNFSNSEISIGF